MNVEFKELLHPRILKHCEPLCIDGRYKHAALEAMTQVEVALKEQSGIKNKFGVNLCSGFLGEGKSIQLRVPFGEEAQKAAERLFAGVFSYYRNYAAHDGSNIDKRIWLRVMVLASELRDLIGASALSFADVGGVDGLITLGIVSAGEELRRLLHLLDGYTIPDEIVDGFFEALALNGFSERQLQAVIDIGLVEYGREPYVPSEAEWSPVERFGDTFIPDSVGWFALTPLGKAVMQGVARNAT